MKTRSLKTTIVIALSALGLAFAAIPTTAEAGGHSSSCYSHRCGSCGGAVYKRRAIVGYSRCGDPIFRWVPISHRCSHRSHSSGGYYSGSRHSHAHPHDVIFGILGGILDAHSHRHHGRGCR